MVWQAFAYKICKTTEFIGKQPVSPLFATVGLAILADFIGKTDLIGKAGLMQTLNGNRGTAKMSFLLIYIELFNNLTLFYSLRLLLYRVRQFLEKKFAALKSIWFIEALDQIGGHQSRAARLLGLNATTLNSKIKTYNIPARN